MTREAALAQLAEMGVPLGMSGDVRSLRREIDASARVMPLLFNPRRQCRDKLRFTSESDARKAAKRTGNPFLAAYLCFHCGYHHNGNPPRGMGR